MALVNIKKGFTGVQSGGDKNIKWFEEVFTVLFDAATTVFPDDYPLTDGTLTISTPDGLTTDVAWKIRKSGS